MRNRKNLILLKIYYSSSVIYIVELYLEYDIQKNLYYCFICFKPL